MSRAIRVHGVVRHGPQRAVGRSAATGEDAAETAPAIGATAINR